MSVLDLPLLGNKDCFSHIVSFLCISEALMIYRMSKWTRLALADYMRMLDRRRRLRWIEGLIGGETNMCPYLTVPPMNDVFKWANTDVHIHQDGDIYRTWMCIHGIFYRMTPGGWVCIKIDDTSVVIKRNQIYGVSYVTTAAAKEKLRNVVDRLVIPISKLRHLYDFYQHKLALEYAQQTDGAC